jgi:hypothetical protein
MIGVRLSYHHYIRLQQNLDITILDIAISLQINDIPSVPLFFAVSLRLCTGPVNDLQLGYAREGKFETY